MSTPFIGQKFTFAQPDGNSIELLGWGDQHYAVFETLDGYTVTRNPASGFYEVAQLSPDHMGLQPVPQARSRADGGRAGVAARLRIAPEAARAAGREGAMRLGGRRCDERRRERKTAMRSIRMMAAAGGPALAPPQRTTVGDYVGLCLLIDFSDVQGTITQAEVERFCNQVGYSGFGNKGSVHDFFLDNSIGRCRYTNIVTPYYRAQHPKTHYTDPAIPMGTRARELIREALAHWKSQGFDFNGLTADGSGNVYALNVFYAGPVVNNWSEGLWPHAWMLGAQVPLVSGKAAFDYQFTAMGAELSLGTFCHENGHMLCDYPDLYDYGNESAGVGMYCLMCAGNHADQKNPVHVSAYLKRLSGWANSVTNLEHGATVTLAAGANDFAMYAKSNDEYFLIENRAKAGRDAALPDAGLAVWHVDEQGDNSNEQMSAASHYELALEQADGLFELERSRDERGDVNDLYSGAVARFADDTTPNSKWWDGTASHLTLEQISPVGAQMSFRSRFSNIATPPPAGGNLVGESTPGRAIPDNQAVGISDIIAIAQALTIADLKVALDINHSYRGDLQVTLFAPWGAAIVLHPKNQGGNADHLKATYDASSVAALAAWRGRGTQGDWRLEVKDLAPADSGRLNRWSLEFATVAVAIGPVLLQEAPGTLIPDHPAAGIERSLASAAAGQVGSVEVSLDISHSYIGDLRVSLVSPAGAEVALHKRSGAQADNILATYTHATTPDLDKLAGQAIAGAWRLRLSDHEAADVGKLNAWRVTIQPAAN